MGSVSNGDGDGDGDGNENVVSKSNFSCLELFRGYSDVFHLENAGELVRDYMTTNGVKVRRKKEKLTVMRSRSRVNLKFG